MVDADEWMGNCALYYITKYVNKEKVKSKTSSGAYVYHFFWAGIKIVLCVIIFISVNHFVYVHFSVYIKVQADLPIVESNIY